MSDSLRLPVRQPRPSAVAMAVALLALTGLSTGAHAQSAAEAAITQQQLLQQQEQQRQELERERLRARGEQIGGAALEGFRKPPVASRGGACHEIEQVELSGAPSLDPARVEAILGPYRRTCVGADQIEKMLAGLTAAYIDQGLVAARVYLPSQDLRSKTLKLVAAEGRVARIDVRDGGAGSVAVDGAFPGVVGKPLQLRDLEQGIDQINRLQSNRATLDIEPGARPDESVVVVHNKPGPRQHWRVSLDNHGMPSTGREQLGLSAGFDRVFGFNDFWGFSHRRSLAGSRDRKHSETSSADLVVPYGRTTFLAGASRTEYATEVTTPSGQRLVADGHSSVGDLRIDRVLMRDEQRRVAGSVALQTKDTVTNFAGQRLEVASRRLTVLDAGLSADVPVPGGRLRAGIGLTQGLSVLGAMKDADGLPDWAPRAQFSKLRLSAQYHAPFTLAFAGGLKGGFTSQWTAQHTNRPVYGSEQIAIGSLYSVRGFLRQSLTGDRGWFTRNELAVQPTWAIAGEDASTRFYVGIDHGRVHNLAPNVPQGSLTGAALGAQLQWRGLTAELAVTKALKAPAFMTKEGAHGWLALSYSF